MARTFPAVPFERYCDDAVVHCVSQRQARFVAQAIADRMVEVGLRLHPDKTRIVYNQDANRRGRYEHTAFTFLGFTFRARPARARNGEIFASFQPAISAQALKKISGEVRRWRLHRWTGRSIGEIAREINPIVRGWMQYYGAFYRSALYPVLQRINAYLMRWARDKYKRLRSMKKAMAAWQRVTSQYRGCSPTGNGHRNPGGQDDKSPVTSDRHAGICGSPGVRFPRATRQGPRRGRRRPGRLSPVGRQPRARPGTRQCGSEKSGSRSCRPELPARV
jgi:hypothetical protein